MTIEELTKEADKLSCKDLYEFYGRVIELLSKHDICIHCGRDGHYSNGQACQCWNDE